MQFVLDRFLQFEFEFDFVRSAGSERASRFERPIEKVEPRAHSLLVNRRGAAAAAGAMVVKISEIIILASSASSVAASLIRKTMATRDEEHNSN